MSFPLYYSNCKFPFLVVIPGSFMFQKYKKKNSTHSPHTLCYLQLFGIAATQDYKSWHFGVDDREEVSSYQTNKEWIVSERWHGKKHLENRVGGQMCATAWPFQGHHFCLERGKIVRAVPDIQQLSISYRGSLQSGTDASVTWNTFELIISCHPRKPEASRASPSYVSPMLNAGRYLRHMKF